MSSARQALALVCVLAALVALAVWAGDAGSAGPPVASPNDEVRALPDEPVPDMRLRAPDGGSVRSLPVPDEQQPAVGERVAGCRVAGRVLTARGDPAPDVRVLLEHAGASQGWFGSWSALSLHAPELLGARSSGSSPVQATTSGADGRFVFEGVPDGNASVAAVDPAAGMAWVGGLTTCSGDGLPEVTLVLRPGVVLTGQVRDPVGAPVGGAHVWWSAWDREGPGRRLVPVAEVLSDEAGRYETLALPFHEFVAQCGAEGFVEAERVDITVPPGAGSWREDFVLQPMRALEGPIVDLSGRPARLDQVDAPLVVVSSWMDPARVQGGPGGLGPRGDVDRESSRYSVPADPQADDFVSLWCRDVLLGSVAVSAAGRGPALPVDLDLIVPVSSSFLELRVVDGSDGGPLAGARVLVREDLLSLPSERPRSWSGETDGHGVLRLSDLAAGRSSVEVRADGYAPRVVAVDLPRPPNTPLVVELVAGVAEVAGRVVDDAGRAVVAARVVLLSEAGAPALAFPEYQVDTDATGRFLFRGVPAGTYQLIGSVRGRAPATTRATAGGPEVEIVLREGLEVPVHILRDGEPLFAVYSVRIRDVDGVPLVDQHRHGHWVLSMGSPYRARLEPGVYDVEVLVAGAGGGPVRFRAGPGSSATVEVPAADSRRPDR